MKKRTEESEFCRRMAFNRTWDLLTSRWKFYIVYLLADGPMRFGALKRTCSDVSRVTLTAYLRQLEQERLILRTSLDDGGLAVEYALTAAGRAALPAVKALVEWGFMEELE